MREKNNNSGNKRISGNREGEFNPKVKGVGPFGSAQGKQECPTHAGRMDGIDLQAVADDNSKRMGEAVEAAFLCKVCKLRIPVCKPWGDSESYDFVVDWRIGFWRVQVKGGACLERGRYKVGPGGSGKPFSKDDMDFIVVHIVPEDVWYVVPIEMAEGLRTLWFNPRSTRARFEKYREAWCLLDSGREARGTGDLPSVCRSEGVKVRCAVCPLRGRGSVSHGRTPRR